jgi:hypothetical protein
MLFTSAISIYQAIDTFEYGEVSSSFEEVGTLYCHLKFTGTEQMSAGRKRDIRRAKLTYELAPVVLSARDVVLVGGSFYRLLYTPTPRIGCGGRAIYEVEIVEAFDVEVSS